MIFTSINLAIGDQEDDSHGAPWWMHFDVVGKEDLLDIEINDVGQVVTEFRISVDQAEEIIWALQHYVQVARSRRVA